MNITINGRFGVGSINHAIQSHYSQSLKSRIIHFRLDGLEWIALLPAALLVAWTRALRDQGARVIYDLKDISESQLRKVLLEGGIFQAIRNLGAEVHFSDNLLHTRDLVPYQRLSDSWFRNDKMAYESIKRTHSGFFDSIPGEHHGMIEDIFSILVRELSENAFQYGEAKEAYVGLINAESSGSFKTSQYITPYSRGKRYVEIVIGDSGPGIPATLGRLIPADYASPFKINNSQSQTNDLTTSELAIHFAFDFSSTSNPDARSKRIDNLLHCPGSIDPLEIGTGLYHVLALAKAYKADFLLMTGSTFGQFICNGDDVTYVRHNDNKESSHIHFPGTHYLFRFPLNNINENATSKKNFALPSQPIFVPVPFLHRTGEQDSESRVIEHSLLSLDHACSQRTAGRNSVLLLYSAGTPVCTRAVELAVAGIMHRCAGLPTLIWITNTPAVESAIIARNSTSLKTPQHFQLPPIDTISLSDIFSNRFNTVAPFAERETLSDDQSLLINSLTKHIQRTIISYITTDTILLHDGPFVFPNGHFTEHFFQFGLLQHNKLCTQLVAMWIYLQHPSPPHYMIVDSLFMKSVADALIAIYLKACQESPTLLFIESHLTLDQIAFSLSRASLDLPQNGDGIILTDIVLQARRISDILHAVIFAHLDITRIFVAVDARQNTSDNICVDQLICPLSSLTRYNIEVHIDFVALPRKHSVKNYSDYIWWVDRLNGIAKPAENKAPHELSSAEVFGQVATSYIRVGHTNHLGRHFFYRIDFEQFCAQHFPTISEWISNILKRGAIATNTICLVYNQDSSSLRLVVGVLNQLSGLTVKCFTRDEVTNFIATHPIIEKSDLSTKVVLFIPAISTGNTLQLMLDAALRYSSGQITCAVLCTRLSKNDIAFLHRIHNFSGRSLFVEALFRFGASGVNADQEICWGCETVKRIRHRSTLFNNEKTLSLYKATRYIMSALHMEDRSSGVATVQEVTEAYFRSIYTLSEHDPNVSLLLNQFAKRKQHFAAIVNVIGREIDNPAFSKESLRSRSPNILRTLESASRLKTTYHDLTPLYAFYLVRVGSVYFPTELENHLPCVIDTHSNNDEVIQAIISALIISETILLSPIAINELLHLPPAVCHPLLCEFSEYLTGIIGTKDTAVLDSLRMLLVAIENSGDFLSEMRRLEDRILSNTLDISTVAQFRATWLEHVEMPLTNLLKTRFGRELNKSIVPLGTLGQHIACVKSGIAHLSKTASKGNEYLPNMLKHQIDEIKSAVTFLGYRLRHYCCNPSNVISAACDKLRQHFDDRAIFDIPPQHICPIFVSPSDFETIINEVCENIWKHSPNEHQTRVEVTLHRTTSHIVFTFKDNNPGAISFSHLRGIHLVRSKCAIYGATLSIEELTSTFTKAVLISFLPSLTNIYASNKYFHD